MNILTIGINNLIIPEIDIMMDIHVYSNTENKKSENFNVKKINFRYFKQNYAKARTGQTLIITHH